MTNTLNTPIEVLEARYPLRVTRYSLRRGSGGAGRRPGGNGLVRELLFLAPASVTLLTERRRHRPWGSNGGGPGLTGRNLLNGSDVPAKTELAVAPGDCLRIETPGGGGYGCSRTAAVGAGARNRETQRSLSPVDEESRAGTQGSVDAAGLLK